MTVMNRLGKAFSDELEKASRKEYRVTDDGQPAWWMGFGRVLLFTLLLFTAFFILLVRLFHLTVINGHRNRILADGNRTRELVRHAPRGNLLDRTGKTLTVNIPQYRLLRPCRQGEPVIYQGGCTERISREKGDELQKNGLPPGSFLEVDWRRSYPFGESTAHVVGYTGEISGTELKDRYYSLRQYHPGDRVGRMGIETIDEESLRGRDGRELVEVDAPGHVVRTLGRDPEIPGTDETVSVDGALSQAAAAAFPVNMRGAVIVTKPATGEVLVLYSSPSFDPDVFSRTISDTEYRDLFENSDRPMFDRVIGGVYPPGSTFKIVTAVAGLESGAITKDTVYMDTGILTVGKFSFANWYYTQYGRTEGPVNLVRAIERSNDTYFYQAGEAIGIGNIATWARRLGLGSPTGIELPGESSGLMPDPEWKNRQFSSPADLIARNNQWYDGDTYHVAIGQGYLQTTPLQVNTWTDIIANGGNICKPTIRKTGPDGKNIRCTGLNLGQDTLHLITRGMVKACESGGTGWPMFNFGINKPSDPAVSGIAGPDNPPVSTSSADFVRIPVACKTGTAEFGDPKNRTHAWFTVFAPVPEEFVTDPKQYTKIITGSPEISVTVLIEEGGEGSSEAAPIAKKILEVWFRR